MNNINIGWDSTKRAEMTYFHCVPSGQNKNERKGYTRTTTPTTTKKLENDYVKGKYTNMYIYAHPQTFI